MDEETKKKFEELEKRISALEGNKEPEKVESKPEESSSGE